MGNKKFALYLIGLAACFTLYGGAALQAQNKAGALSITVYQDPG